MSYSLELPFIFYKIVAFGPGTKGNGESPLPQTMCHAFWQLLSSSWFCPHPPPSQYSGIVCSRSQHIPAICWVLLDESEDIDMMHIHGQKLLQVFIQQTDKSMTSSCFHLFGAGIPFSTHSWVGWNGICNHPGMCPQSYLMVTRIINMWIFWVFHPDLIDKENAIFVHSVSPLPLFPLPSKREFYLCHKLILCDKLLWCKFWTLDRQRQN